MFCLNKISKSGNDCIGWMSEKNRLFIMNKLEQCIYTSSLTRILLLQKVQVNYCHNHQKVLLLYYWFSNYIYIFTEILKIIFQSAALIKTKTICTIDGVKQFYNMILKIFFGNKTEKVVFHFFWIEIQWVTIPLHT